MTTITIVYEVDESTKTPTCYQIVKTSDDFAGDTKGLVEHITGSHLFNGIKNYKYFTTSRPEKL